MKHTIRFAAAGCAAAALVLAAAAPALEAAPPRAEMVLRQYLPYLGKGRTPPLAVRNYVDGLGTGLVWANAYQIARKRRPLFCAPHLTPPGGDYLPLLDAQIERHPGVRKPYVADATLAMIMLDALMNEYPCENAQSK